MLIAQRLQHHSGVLQNVRLLLQIGEGVHAAVGQHQHTTQRGDLVQHAVGGQMLGTQTVLLIENSTHQVGGAQNALHQEVGLTLGAQRHGLGRAVLIGVAGDDLVVGGVLAQCGKHGADLVHMSHQNGRGDALLTSLHHRLDHGLVMSGCHGDDPGGAALGGGDDAVNGMYHADRPPAQFLLLFKAIYAPEPALFPVILYNIPAAPSTENRSIQ